MLAKLVKKVQKLFLVFLMMLGILTSCGNEPLQHVNVNEIPANLELKRFDKDFFSMRTEHLEEDLSKLRENYPLFYPFYEQEIMGWKPGEVEQNCKMLLSDTNVLKLQDTIQQVFGDFSEQMEILDPAFKRFSAHFPGTPMPSLVLAYTEFLFRSGTDSSLLVLPLEMYLGESYPVYPFFNIPDYMLRRMDKYHLPTVAMIAWLDQNLGSIPSGNRYLDQMIKEGKQLYYLQAMLPNTADTLLTGWTGNQLNWLKENEFQMWTFYINDNYLYSTDGAFYMALLSDGPFTSAPNIPPGSAPRIGAYTGWQIVRAFMDKNPSMSLLDLMQELDGDRILRESGYRP